MPTNDTVVRKTAKRKRSSLSKKSLHDEDSEDYKNSSSDDIRAQITELEREIFESKTKYNNIVVLLKILESRGYYNDEIIIAAAVSLSRIFTKLMISGDMIKRKKATEKEAVVIKWLREQYTILKRRLIILLDNGSSGATTLTLCMRLIRTEGLHMQAGQEYAFPTLFLMDIVRGLLFNRDDEAMILEEFNQKYFEKYNDIRFYTLEAIVKIINSEVANKSDSRFFESCLGLLASIEPVSMLNEKPEDFFISEPQKKTHVVYSPTQHKKRAQAAWLALMRLEMDKNQRKSLLKLMNDSIVPCFTNPEILMDFLTDSYNAGGSMSLLALSGVFYLIQEKNLDYPQFYTKLYSLLNADLLHSKHRSKFFRLLTIFLGSTHLPAMLVASFIKRLSRLTLNAPPSGIVIVIPWIYNHLVKHPQCTFMIHREIRDNETKILLENEGMNDPFLANEEDPVKTKAIDSSLWEIFTLQSHYHPNVATLAKIISEQFTKHSYNMEDFLDHSYGSLLDLELSKGVKKPPVVEFEIPASTFTESDKGSHVAEKSLLTKIWTFS